MRLLKKRNFFERVAFALKDTENLKTPILIKEAVDSELKIKELQVQLEQSNDPLTKAKILKEAQLLTLGVKGEASVLFELQNSFLPLHIIHDLRIEHGEHKAQLDFVVLTRKFIIVIEVKNYYGNILVNEKDEFIRRVYKNNRLVFQEGFYSPIRQVQRQTAILENLLKEREIITQTPIKHVVVFTNPKTILDIKNASDEVKNRILRADGLVQYISNVLKENSPVHFLDNRMNEISNSILSLHQPSNNSHIEDLVEAKLLEETISQDKNQESAVTTEEKSIEKITAVKKEQQLKEALIEFRKQEATKTNVKAFYIFTNKTLEELVMKKPETVEELKDIHGIGKQKIESYGDEVIRIIRRFE